MAELRYITIPGDIVAEVDGAQDGQATFTFSFFIHSRTGDGVFGRDLDGVLSAVSIRQHMSQGDPGSVRALPLDQWQQLCEAVRKPSSPYNPSVMAQLLPFARAILDAPSTDPRVAEGKEERS